MRQHQGTIEIQVLASPAAYTLAQIRRACKIASTIKSRLFVLCEPPEKCAECFDEPETFCVSCGHVAEG